MGDLTTHFSKSEFVDHSDGTLPAGMPTKKLLTALEKLRTHVGKPLTIVSGFRSKAHNKAVNGAKNSQHLTGNAADIPPGYATIDECRNAGFIGVGINEDHKVIHVDTRKGSFIVFHDNW